MSVLVLVTIPRNWDTSYKSKTSVKNCDANLDFTLHQFVRFSCVGLFKADRFLMKLAKLSQFCEFPSFSRKIRPISSQFRSKCVTPSK